MITLRERYEAKQADLNMKTFLIEHIRHVDRTLLREQRAQLIVEALDAAEYKVISQIIKKLDAVKGKGLGTLDAAISAAQGELNKYASGGFGAMMANLKSKVGFSNPAVKAITLVSALEAGFKQIPDILKNNLGELGNDSLSKSIVDIAPEKKDVIVKTIMKAIRPAGKFAALTGKIPYVKDTKALANEIMTVNLQVLNDIHKVVTTGPQSDAVASDAAATGKGAAETGTTATPAPSGAEAAPAAGAPATAPGAEPAATATPPAAKRLSKEDVPAIAAALKMNAKRAKATIQALQNAGYKISKG